jgi:hypothetical protein
MKADRVRSRQPFAETGLFDRSTHGHGRHAEALGQVRLRGQRAAVGEQAEGDGVGQAARDGVGAPLRLEGAKTAE